MSCSLLDRIQRHRHRIVQTVASAALFTAAGVMVIPTHERPLHVVVRPAAAAISTPVVARAVRVIATPSRPAPRPWELANIDNPRVDSWVRRFTTSLKADFTAALDRGAKFDSMISAKLVERKMPRELFYLAMIESEFKPAARSRVSAVGLWQFMASTARSFGLSIGRKTDERKDPVKATDAALRYLSELHTQFGSWYLAAAAYNAGAGTVGNALRRVTGRTSGTDSDFYRISPDLPRETRDYVPKLIAAARVAKARSTLGPAHATGAPP